MKIVIAALISLSTATPLVAGEYQHGYSTSQTCTKNEYREEYFPGTKDSPGYVESWTETVEVPCKTSRSSKYSTTPSKKVDNNDCSQGSLIGGLLGAGLTMSGTRGKDRWWAVPAGGAAGAIVGCSIDGG